MNDQQILTIALASAPTMLTVLIGILVNNARLSDLNNRMAELRQHMDSRFDQVDVRFDETKELWRSELHRVEEVLDARLKHIEERQRQ
jgi:F0F1-type ATP synthase delta subunit